ncbi:Com family DNA-binding transcriptional regulator [Azorhizobium doebereinerae]|uniref:Com family DNA-binding transcriptional regulator n=1 Tax=Azorhizobium doebereinerae TaxID=281091 RepID=UPI0009FE26CC
MRCGSCRALLFRAGRGAISGTIEIKCRRCGTLNALRPPEPKPERRERAVHVRSPVEEQHTRSAAAHSQRGTGRFQGAKGVTFDLARGDIRSCALHFPPLRPSSCPLIVSQCLSRVPRPRADASRPRGSHRTGPARGRAGCVS